MASNLPPYSPAVQSMLAEGDLNALVAALRTPANAGLRTQAARALGEMGDFDATESLIRAVLEDPDSIVQSAARQALQALHGSQAELAIASYRAGPPEVDAWLVEPEDEDFNLPERADGFLTEADLDGILLVVSHESNPAIREKAIRALQHFSDTRSTDILAYLTLYSDDRSIRSAAREVLEARFGDQAGEIIQTAAASLDEEEWQDENFEDIQDEAEVGSGAEEVDEHLQGDLDENRSAPAGAWGRLPPERQPSAFPQGPAMPGQERDSRVVQEVGVSWRFLLVAAIAILILVVLFSLNP